VDGPSRECAMVNDVSGPSAPASFSEDNMDEWSLWVLENGLPILPIAVKKGESVPVARWVGTTVAAVLHVQWMWGHEPDDDFLVSEIVCFRREGGVWEQGDGSGGTGWYSAVLERSDSIGPRETRTFGRHGEGGLCLTSYGITGTAARFIEVKTNRRTERAPLESPIGAWIAAWDPAFATTVRILGDGGSVLHSASFTPWPLVE
jgi:hypothetical protein